MVSPWCMADAKAGGLNNPLMESALGRKCVPMELATQIIGVLVMNLCKRTFSSFDFLPSADRLCSKPWQMGFT